MSKISKELIESYRKIVLPFVSNQLCKADFEGQGEIDKTEFEQDFNEILNLALSSLNPKGDLISREALKKHKFTTQIANGVANEEIEVVPLCEIDNAPPVQQSILPLSSEADNAYMRGYEVGKAEGILRANKRPKGEYETACNVLLSLEQIVRSSDGWEDSAVEAVHNAVQTAIKCMHERPQGEWIEKEETPASVSYYCSACKTEGIPITPFCPNCGAKMKGGAE